tara:strand:- start:2062 stop:2628 length:567 start_codon:yes stop_codon:yes gene_type:complete
MQSSKAQAFLKRNALAKQFTRLFNSWDCDFEQGEQQHLDKVNHDLVRALSQKCRGAIKEKYGKKAQSKFGSPQNIYFCLARALNAHNPDDHVMGVDIEVTSDNVDKHAQLLGYTVVELKKELGPTWKWKGPTMTRAQFLKRLNNYTPTFVQQQSDSDDDDDLDLDVLSILAHGEPLPLSFIPHLMRCK